MSKTTSDMDSSSGSSRNDISITYTAVCIGDAGGDESKE
jgi:hypothetical protein